MNVVARKRVTITNGKAKGIECPRCGCRDLRVTWTRDAYRARRRGRVCRSCGLTVQTTENVDEMG